MIESPLLSSLKKLDFFLAKTFLISNGKSGSDLEKRLKDFNTRYEKNNIFLFPQNQNIFVLDEIYTTVEKWLKSLENSNFHKSPDYRSAFLSFKALVLIIDNHVDFDFDNKNILLYKLAQIIYSSILDIHVKSIEVSVRSDFDLVYKKNEELGKSFSGYYSKSLLTNLVEDRLCSWLIILANGLKIELSLEKFIYIISQIIMILDFNKIIDSDTRKIVIGKNIIKHGVKYYIGSYTKNLIALNYSSMLASISLNEPVVLVNKFFTSDKGIDEFSAFLVPDDVYSATNLIKKNPRYGFLKKIIKKESDFYSENTTLLKLKTEFEELKSNEMATFRDISNNPLWEIINKENRTYSFVDWKLFFELVDDFLKYNLKDFNLSFETSDEDLAAILNTYSSIESNFNKKTLSNILIFIHLKGFMQLVSQNDKNSKIYFSFFYDFRGRKYYDNVISPTNFIYSRFYLYYGFYKNFELEKNINDSLNSKALKSIEYLCVHLEKIYHIIPNFLFDQNSKKEKFRKCLIVHYLIALGVINKSKILLNKELCKDGYTLTTELFFFRGLDEFLMLMNNEEEYFTKLSAEDFEKTKLYQRLIMIDSKTNFTKKTMIGLDFSCSGHQIRYMLNGFENLESYELININGTNRSVDIYSLVLELCKKKLNSVFEHKEIDNNDVFLNSSFNVKDFCEEENLSIKSKKIKKITTLRDELKRLVGSIEDLTKLTVLFKRKYMKKSLMTGEYNATFPTFSNYFEASIDEFGTEDEKNLLKKNKKKVNFLLVCFYRFSKDLNNHEFFKSPNSKSFINSMANSESMQIAFWDGFKANLACFAKSLIDKRIYFHFEMNGKPLRQTQQITSYENIIDKKSTLSSFGANLIHGVDGCIVRTLVFYWNDDRGLYSIHDEFWVDHQKVFIFKDDMNRVIKLNLFKKNNNRNKKEHDFFDKKIMFFYSYNVIL